MKNILIYGASGHSKMILDIIHKKNNYNVVGFIDSFKEPGEKVYGYYILGNLDSLPILKREYKVDGIIIGIGNNYYRKRAYTKIKKLAPNISFVPVVHPSAIIANDIEIPMGSVLMAGAIINADAKLGKFCIINTNASLGHDSIMNNFSSLSSGVVTGGNVQLGECSAVCIRATVVNNRKIGNHTVIGASSLVLRDIGNNKLAYGSPIDTVKERKKEHHYFSK